MERAEIAELFYNALVGLNDVEELDRFLSPSAQWTLSAADPHTMGEEPSPDAITFSGKEGCRQLARYFQETLKVFAAPDRFAETTIAARLTFDGSKIIKGQIRVSWPLVF